MPVERCQSGGRSGYRWGPSGSCFVGPDSLERAQAVGRAIAARRRRKDQRVAEMGVMPPIAIEEDYRIFLARRVADLHAQLVRAVTGALARTDIPETGRRSDAREEDAAELERAIQLVSGSWKRDRQGQLRSIANSVEEVATDVDGFTTMRVASVVEAVSAIDVTGIRAEAGGMSAAHMGWVADNVALIRNIEDKHIDDVALWVTRTVEGGGSTATLAKRLEQRLGVSQRRATTIARNEIGNLNAAITKGRQESLGVTQFVWTTAGDDLVRDEHAAIDGQVFDWATGAPGVGMPGEPINCRCVGIAVLP